MMLVVLVVVGGMIVVDAEGERVKKGYSDCVMIDEKICKICDEKYCDYVSELAYFNLSFVTHI